MIAVAAGKFIEGVGAAPLDGAAIRGTWISIVAFQRADSLAGTALAQISLGACVAIVASDIVRRECAANSGLARIVRAWISIVAWNRCVTRGANTSYACVLQGARVTIVACKRVVGEGTPG